MGLFTGKLIEKVLNVGENITGKIIGNSKNASQLDARNKEQADGTSFLDRIIHEAVILIVIGALILNKQLQIDEPTIEMFRQAFWVMIGFLYGRSKK